MGELIPYRELDPEDIGRQFRAAVSANTDYFEQRNLIGVLHRYGKDEDRAIYNVRKGQTDEQPEHLVYILDSGNVGGGGSVFDELPLYSQRLPIPTAIGRRIHLAVAYPYANPNVHGWVANGDEEAHADLYRMLVGRVIGNQAVMSPIYGLGIDRRPRPWTVEPVRSPAAVHAAIAASGLDMIATKRFDDGESRWQNAPPAVLYAKLWSNWYSAHGKLKELKTQRISFLDRFDRDIDEQESRNPIGR